jgi:hypothetical protein
MALSRLNRRLHMSSPVQLWEEANAAQAPRNILLSSNLSNMARRYTSGPLAARS